MVEDYDDDHELALVAMGATDDHAGVADAVVGHRVAPRTKQQATIYWVRTLMTRSDRLLDRTWF